MSVCVEKISHSCGSSDGLQVFEQDGNYTGYCFVCQTYIEDPYQDKEPGYVPSAPKEKTPEQIARELQSISEWQTLDLPDRCLRKESLEYFGVKVGVSETDGTTPFMVALPYHDENSLISVKMKTIGHKDKTFIIGDHKAALPFGWHQAIATGAKNLIITEGEEDAVAVFQAIKDGSKPEYRDYNPAVISLSSGSSSVKRDLTRLQNEVNQRFKEVVLAFDMDDAGQLAVEDAMQIFPHATGVKLPAKDANECLMQGKVKGLRNSVLFQNATPKNSNVINASTLYDDAKVAAEWGLSWPWESMTQLTRGIRFGETYYLGAGVKMGKSEIVNALAAHLMVEHGLNVFLAKPEEANKKTVKMVLGKVAGRIFHDPKVEFDDAAYEKARELVDDKLLLLDLYQHVGWSSLRADIIKAVNEDGAKAVFIDPITNLTNGIAAGETNTVLQQIAQDLSALAKDLDIVVFIFCHLKAAETQPSHERGGKVLSHQFSGSRAMMRSCNYMIGVEGDKSPEVSREERNVRKLVLLEDREFGEVGIVPLYWDSNTSLFTEIPR